MWYHSPEMDAKDTFVAYDMFGNPVVVRRSRFDRLPVWLKALVVLALLAASFLIVPKVLDLAFWALWRAA